MVKEYQRAVVFRLGKIRDGTAKGPGILFMLPCIDHVVIADMRTQTFEVPPQEILTKDSVSILVDAVVYIKIFDPTLSIIHVENAQYSTRELSATCLRKVLGTKTLQEALQEREIIARCLQEVLDDVTHEWGVEVERVEVKDISLPTQMQRVMAIEAEASREYKASIIYADGELNASYALRNAADTFRGSPMAIQLRYMQTLATITAKNESTIMFPVPIDMSCLYGAGILNACDAGSGSGGVKANPVSKLGANANHSTTQGSSKVQQSSSYKIRSNPFESKRPICYIFKYFHQN